MTNQENSNLIDQLTGKNFRRYNIKIAKILSLNSSVYLADLCDRYEYHLDNGEIEGENDWFYYTEDKCFERTALSRKEQETAINLLIDNNLIEKKRIGAPSKRHYRIKFQQLKDLFLKSEENAQRPKRECETSKTRMHNVQNENASIYNETQDETHYETTTTKEEIVVVVSEKNEGLKEFSKDDLYFQANLSKRDWTSAEIETSYEAFKGARNVVTDPLRYCEGVINKTRLNASNQQRQSTKKQSPPRYEPKTETAEPKQSTAAEKPNIKLKLGDHSPEFRKKVYDLAMEKMKYMKDQGLTFDKDQILRDSYEEIKNELPNNEEIW